MLVQIDVKFLYSIDELWQTHYHHIKSVRVSCSADSVCGHRADGSEWQIV